MKTIFITITKGTLARNFLRTDVLKNVLKNNNIKVVIILPEKIHDYFKKEFSHKNIIIEKVNNKPINKFKKFFIVLFNGLVYTETEKRKIKFGGGNKNPDAKMIFIVKHFLFSALSKVKILKYFARWIEFNIFIEKEYDYLFTKYHPDLLFCSSIYSKIDIIFIKAAKRFKVISISTPKSWDTVGRLFFRAPSDKIILNNSVMKDWVIKEQLMKENNIFICGMPQFDIYKNKKQYLTKQQFCEKTNLDPLKPIILYASEGLWTHWDEVYINDLIKNHNILNKYNLILRPHFSNAHQQLYYKFKKYKNIYIDDENLRITNMFGDRWDPTEENMSWLADVINISDVVVTFMTTFVLDVFCYNKPVINIYYDLPESFHLKSEMPIIPMKELYNCFHYNTVLKEKATILAKNGVEVMEWIEKYLKNSKTLKDEREKTVSKLCYRVDGHSADRISQAIFNHLK